MNFLKNALLFTIGGGAYTSLELLFRRRSHISMFVLGGGCFLAIGRLWRSKPRMGLLLKMLLGSAICTAGELVTGLAVNRDYAIWDYRRLPGNFLGQICLPFSLLWMALTPAAGVVYRWCNHKISLPCVRGGGSP